MLLYFILGALFIYLGLPLMQNFLSIVQAWTQLRVYKFAAKVYQIKKQLNIIDQQDEEKDSHPIGFVCTQAIGQQIENEEIVEEEEE